MMNPANDPSVTSLLTPIFGASTAGIISFFVLAKALLPEIMPYLPVADAASPAWYRITYGILARLTGNYGKNAPVPPSGAVAGSPVPVPPSLKPNA